MLARSTWSGATIWMLTYIPAGAFLAALSDRPNLIQYQLQHYQSDQATAHPTLE